MSYDKRQHVREGMPTRTIPRPLDLSKTEKEELYDAILEMYAGTEVRRLITLLKDNDWSKTDVQAFKDYYIRTGTRDGWLYTELFGD